VISLTDTQLCTVMAVAGALNWDKQRSFVSNKKQRKKSRSGATLFGGRGSDPSRRAVSAPMASSPAASRKPAGALIGPPGYAGKGRKFPFWVFP